jgi:hypothetical protein
MLTHPCEGLSKAAIDAFDMIAAGVPPGCSKETLKLLMERGLVERHMQPVRFNDGLPPSTRFEYSVPYAHHIQWCDWWTAGRHTRRRLSAVKRKENSGPTDPELPL